MPDVEERLGKVIAAVFRVGRTLDEGALDDLLENIATEVAAAMMEQEAHQRSGRETATVSRPRTGNVLQFEPRGDRIR